MKDWRQFYIFCWRAAIDKCRKSCESKHASLWLAVIFESNIRPLYWVVHPNSPWDLRSCVEVELALIHLHILSFFHIKFSTHFYRILYPSVALYCDGWHASLLHWRSKVKIMFQSLYIDSSCNWHYSISCVSIILDLLAMDGCRQTIRDIYRQIWLIFGYGHWTYCWLYLIECFHVFDYIFLFLINLQV